jgi:acetyltransferase-like isoleucine patch superfamily enzyme
MDAIASKPGAHFEDPLSLLIRVKTRLYTLWLSATYPFAAKGRNLSIQYPCAISRRVAHQIKLGNSVIIRKDAWLNIVPNCSNELKIIIGDNSLIGALNVISSKNFIQIEDDVIIGTSVLIQDHHHAYENISLPIRAQGVTPGGRIRIEQGCWIGKGAAIICNEGELIIGRNSVVGANSLVTRSFPPYSVIVGNPARLARQFDPARGKWVGGGGTAQGMPSEPSV